MFWTVQGVTVVIDVVVVDVVNVVDAAAQRQQNGILFQKSSKLNQSLKPSVR